MSCRASTLKVAKSLASNNRLREELDHTFLWCHMKCLPERGRIGIFNRSYYEDVLVVKVHPEILDAQPLPQDKRGKSFWNCPRR